MVATAAYEEFRDDHRPQVGRSRLAMLAAIQSRRASDEAHGNENGINGITTSSDNSLNPITTTSQPGEVSAEGDGQKKEDNDKDKDKEVEEVEEVEEAKEEKDCEKVGENGVLKPTLAPAQVQAGPGMLIDLLDDFDAEVAASSTVLDDSSRLNSTRCPEVKAKKPKDIDGAVGANILQLLPSPPHQQLQLQSPEELSLSKRMTRLFIFADFMISNSLEALNTPEEFSLAYFEHVTGSLAFYIRELTHLVAGGTDGHFLMVTTKVKQLQQHLTQLDKLKVRAAMLHQHCCSCSSFGNDGNDGSCCGSDGGGSGGGSYSATVIGGNSSSSSSTLQRSSTPPPKVQRQQQQQQQPLPPEKLIPFDGDILNWLHFSTAYHAIIGSSAGGGPHGLATNPGAQFRLLYQNVDETTRSLLLSDVDPRAPDMPAVLHRLTAAFEECPKKVLPQVKRSLGRLPPLKNRYSSASWLGLMKAANQAAVLLAHVFRQNATGTPQQQGTTTTDEVTIEDKEAAASAALVKEVLLGKLPPRYQNLFKDSLTGGRWPSLERFAAFAARQLTVIGERTLRGLPTEGAWPVSERLCPVCEADYHQAENCDFERAVRLEAVKAKELCERCLLPLAVHADPKAAAHHSMAVCSRCGKRDHHLALCPLMS